MDKNIAVKNVKLKKLEPIDKLKLFYFLDKANNMIKCIDMLGKTINDGRTNR